MNLTHYPPPHVWQNFFTAFRDFNAVNKRRKIVVTNGKAAERFFSQFKNRYTPFVQSGGTINVWDVAGIGTDEVRNCEVLGWLLDCHGSHGQGAAFLRCFLESLNTVPLNTAPCMAGLPQPAQIHAPYRTIRENTYEQGCVDANSPKSRVDIVIESESFLMFIEVKIHARETGNQLERYSDILRSRASGKPCGLVFLTPTGRAARDDSAGGIVCLSWSHLADSFENFIHAQGAGNGAVSQEQPLWAALVQQFCSHIRQF